MKVMKVTTKKIRSKARMDAESRWLLAADCEKAWLHPDEEEETMLEKMKKEDDKRKMGELHQSKGCQMIMSAEGSACSCIRSRSPQHGEEEHRS